MSILIFFELYFQNQRKIVFLRKDDLTFNLKLQFKRYEIVDIILITNQISKIAKISTNFLKYIYI